MNLMTDVFLLSITSLQDVISAFLKT